MRCSSSQHLSSWLAGTKKSTFRHLKTSILSRWMLLREHYNDASRANIKVVSIWRTKVLFYTFASWKTVGKLGTSLRRQAFKLHLAMGSLIVGTQFICFTDAKVQILTQRPQILTSVCQASKRRIFIAGSCRDLCDSGTAISVRSSSGEEEEEEA